MHFACVTLIRMQTPVNLAQQHSQPCKGQITCWLVPVRNSILCARENEMHKEVLFFVSGHREIKSGEFAIYCLCWAFLHISLLPLSLWDRNSPSCHDCFFSFPVTCFFPPCSPLPPPKIPPNPALPLPLLLQTHLILTFDRYALQSTPGGGWGWGSPESFWKRTITTPFLSFFLQCSSTWFLWGSGSLPSRAPRRGCMLPWTATATSTHRYGCRMPCAAAVKLSK